MALAVLLLAPLNSPASTAGLDTLVFVSTDEVVIPAPPVSVSMQMALSARSDSVEPSADESFQLVVRQSLTVRALIPDWFGDSEVGSVSASLYVARGSVTRSNNV